MVDLKGFSIIIPTFDRAELLRIALASVQDLRVPEGWVSEILVIDNNSADHTIDVIKECARTGPLEVRRIVETKQGLNHGRNRGLQDALFDDLIYLDDDMQVDPGWLEGYVEAWKKFDADCVVGPVEPMFEEEIPDWVSPHALESVTSAYSRKGEAIMLLNANLGHEVPGCNFAVRRAVASEAGGFHPMLDRSGKRMLAGGDWEFGERLVSLNKRVVYAPRCRIRHFISESKLSKDGLRKRWIGLGASNRALMRLRGEEPALRRRIRLFLRMKRFFFWSIRSLSANERSAAFQWELEARRLYGFLFKCPKTVKPRSWPPTALSLTKDLPV